MTKAAEQKASVNTPTAEPDNEAESIGRLLAMMDSNAPRIMAIADNSELSAEEQMRAICEIDVRFYGKKSPDWAKMLRVEGSAIRKTAFWRIDRRKWIGEAVAKFREQEPDSELPDWLNETD